MWQQVDRADVSRCFFDIPDYIFCPLDYMQMYENYNLLHYTRTRSELENELNENKVQFVRIGMRIKSQFVRIRDKT